LCFRRRTSIFSDTQFEAYRSLGEHVGDVRAGDRRRGHGRAQGRNLIEDWFADIGKTCWTRWPGENLRQPNMVNRILTPVAT